MDYLAKFYKNQSEVLSEQIKVLEMQLKTIMESEAPASVFSGSGQGQQRFSDADLEAQMRRHKKSSIFKTYTDDEQSQEYKDAKAELERRRGAKAPAAPAREPVEQMGPVGSPSAVATRTEVQKAQQVADRTGLPTALPTNVAPGTQYMTDMDGNPIAVQPRAKKPMSPKDFNQKAAINQMAMEVEVDDGGDYIYKDGYAQSPTSWRERHPSNYPPDVTLGRVQAGSTPEARKDLEDAAMGKGQYDPKKAEAEYMARLNRFMPKRGTSMFDTETRGGYSTPPSPSLAPTTRGTSYINEPMDNISPTQPRINPSSAPVDISDIDITPRALPKSEVRRIVNQPAAQPAVPAGEDFSSFWTKRLHGGDVKSYMRDQDLIDMMKQNKRSNLFGPAISDDKQTIEYRAAQAELRRRGKLK